MWHVRRALALLAMVLSCLSTRALAAADSMDALRTRGVLTVAVYKDFAPFNDQGKGIDAALAARLAEKLGLKLALVPFDALDNVAADLREMIAKAPLLGRPAVDLMLHVPLDPYLARANDQVLIFAPYMRESLAIARNRNVIAQLPAMAALESHRIGADRGSISALILLSVEQGRYRDQISLFPDLSKAIAALKSGELAAVMGVRSELQGALGSDERFEISHVPAPQVRPRTWLLGLAVRASAPDLARSLEAALGEMIAAGEVRRIFNAHSVQWIRP